MPKEYITCFACGRSGEFFNKETGFHSYCEPCSVCGISVHSCAPMDFNWGFHWLCQAYRFLVIVAGLIARLCFAICGWPRKNL